MKEKEEIKVLFVCMGNICRSPTAQGIFSKLVEDHELDRQIAIDSAGTHAYHVGNPPDMRATEAALRRGIDLTPQRARRVKPEDFVVFDYILAMDQDNYVDLESICPSGQEHKLKLFVEFASGVKGKDVPDPYYGGDTGFERVLDLIETASEDLLKALRKEHSL